MLALTGMVYWIYIVFCPMWALLGIMFTDTTPPLVSQVEYGTVYMNGIPAHVLVGISIIDSIASHVDGHGTYMYMAIRPTLMGMVL